MSIVTLCWQTSTRLDERKTVEKTFLLLAFLHTSLREENLFLFFYGKLQVYHQPHAIMGFLTQWEFFVTNLIKKSGLRKLLKDHLFWRKTFAKIVTWKFSWNILKLIESSLWKLYVTLSILKFFPKLLLIFPSRIYFKLAESFLEFSYKLKKRHLINFKIFFIKV